jgi:hypothetical protein
MTVSTPTGKTHAPFSVARAAPGVRMTTVKQSANGQVSAFLNIDFIEIDPSLFTK